MKKLVPIVVLLGLMIVAANSVSAQTNVALNKKAAQSSTDYDSPASRAVNGKTNSTYGGQDITHTKEENGAWWQVDLEKVYDISKIEIWNRADCCWERLKNFYLMVSETPINANSTAKNTTSGPHSFTQSTATHPSMILTDRRRGRYIRIFLNNGTQPLSLGEVQVFGQEATSASNTPSAGNVGTASSPTVATKFPITAGSALKKGVKYPSPSGNHFLVFADDGNVVVATTRGDGFVWGLNTVTNNFSQSARVEVTPDGRLAAYDAKGKALWTSTGKPAPNTTLNVTFGGALQLVSATGEILWSSDGNISPVTTVIKSANVKPCQADAVWSKCIEMPDPKITIRGTRLVSDAAMNAVANVYTELTRRFNPAYPRSTFDGFRVYLTNGEPGSQLDTIKELQVFGENGKGSNSRNLLRGGANGTLLWISEQMICKAGVRTVNADYPDKADYTLRTYDQVIHEFGHAIDQRYKLGQRIQTIFRGGAPGEDFAWAIQHWFGSPGGASPANQEALMKEIFASRATFSCEGLKP